MECPTPRICEEQAERHARIMSSYVWGSAYPWRHVTVRELRSGDMLVNPWTYVPIPRQKYVVVDAEDDTMLASFGLALMADTREEITYWAQRWVSKNGGHYLPPDGWEQVVGALREKEDS